MSRLIALLSAALLVLVGLSSAHAADPVPDLPTDLTVSGMPTTLVKGDTLEIAATTCRPLPESPVVLERRVAPDGSWHDARAGSLDATGSVRFTVKPNSLRSFDFRVRVAGEVPLVSDYSRVRMVEASRTNPSVGTVRAALATSPSVIVAPLPAELGKGTSFAIVAAACPGDAGAPVGVERRVAPDGSWSTVRTSTLAADGTQSFSLKPNSLRSFDFRVRVAGNTNAVSTEQRVEVVESTTVAAPAPAVEQKVAVSDIPATLVTGDTFTYTVRTEPAAASAPVTIEKRINDGDWFTVRDTRLDSTGAKSFDLKPIAKRDYSFRAIVGTEPPVTSRDQTVTVVAEGGSSGSSGGSSGSTNVPRYQLFDDRSDQYIKRGTWVTLESYPLRGAVPSKNIIQLNMNIRAATGDRPTYLLVGWQRSDNGERVGVQTRAIPVKTGDRPFQVSHDYTFVGGSGAKAQLFIPGSGQVKVTTEVVKAIAHPTG